MTDIALLTEARYLQPDLHDPYQCQIALEEALLAQALRRLGLSVQRLAWDDAQQDWSRVRAAVLRSTWDYVARQQQFEDWLDQVERRRKIVANRSQFGPGYKKQRNGFSLRGALEAGRNR